MDGNCAYRENRAARPRANEVEVTKRAGISSLKMGLTGTILLFFIVFHLLHFTVRSIYPEFNELMTSVGALLMAKIHDVYTMVLAGFRRHGSLYLCNFYVFALRASGSWRKQCFFNP